MAVFPSQRAASLVTWLALLLLVVVFPLCGEVQGEGTTSTTARAAIDVSVKPLDRLPPALVIGKGPPAGWTHLVLLVHPRLGSGNVKQLPAVAGQYASMFKLTILANVVQRQNDGANRFILDKVGVGFAMTINGRNVVVDSKTAGQLGAELGVIGKAVLLGNEKCLKDVVQVARHSTMLVFDAKANVLRRGDHEQMVIRHLVWVSPRSGRLGTVVWLLEDNGKDKYELAEDQLQYLPPNMHEDRVINVKTLPFASKIPTPNMLAIVRIPQGTPIEFTPELAQAATEKRFSTAAVRQLAGELSKALQQASVASQRR